MTSKPTLSLERGQGGKMEEKPTAAFALSLIGGILELLGGFVATVIHGAVTLSAGGSGAVIGVCYVILGLIITLGSVLMYINPSSTHTWGGVILILSIISIFNIIALIGGYLALAWKPHKQGTPPPPPPPRALGLFVT